jgi:hypothetical protein
MLDTIKQAYKDLVPKDQLVVNAMIISLHEKDRQLGLVLRDVERLMSDLKTTETSDLTNKET